MHVASHVDLTLCLLILLPTLRFCAAFSCCLSYDGFHDGFLLLPFLCCLSCCCFPVYSMPYFRAFFLFFLYAPWTFLWLLKGRVLVWCIDRHCSALYLSFVLSCEGSMPLHDKNKTERNGAIERNRRSLKEPFA